MNIQQILEEMAVKVHYDESIKSILEQSDQSEFHRIYLSGEVNGVKKLLAPLRYLGSCTDVLQI